MATDERDEEREFLAGLQARTGRDLGAWMTAIAAQGSADKNEIIDWLREQGLPFARASWLERIHRNGGKPIYSGEPVKRPLEKAREAESRPASVDSQPVAPAPAPPSSKRSATATPTQQPLADAEALERLVAAAKGYRPLYHLLETEMRNVVPALAIAPKAGYLSLGAPAEFGVLTLHAIELRLGLDLGEHPFDPLLQKAKLKGPGAAITHMVVLTDARQVNDGLLAAIKTANARVNR